jgi:hypothetical protein
MTDVPTVSEPLERPEPEELAEDCPAWCDGRHDVLYHVADEPGERNHYREIGRLNEEGATQMVVGIALTTDEFCDPISPCVELLHVDKTGQPVEELLCGDVYLSPGEAEALAPLLVKAARMLRTGSAE